jgi:cell division protein FtsL
VIDMDVNSLLLILLVIETLIALFIIVIFLIRIRQLTRDLNDLRRKMEVTDEELYRLSEDIKEFRNLKLW